MLANRIFQWTNITFVKHVIKGKHIILNQKNVKIKKEMQIKDLIQEITQGNDIGGEQNLRVQYQWRRMICGTYIFPGEKKVVNRNRFKFIFWY